MANSELMLDLYPTKSASHGMPKKRRPSLDWEAMSPDELRQAALSLTELRIATPVNYRTDSPLPTCSNNFYSPAGNLLYREDSVSSEEESLLSPAESPRTKKGGVGILGKWFSSPKSSGKDAEENDLEQSTESNDIEHDQLPFHQAVKNGDRDTLFEEIVKSSNLGQPLELGIDSVDSNGRYDNKEVSSSYDFNQYANSLHIFLSLFYQTIELLCTLQCGALT